jgi:hypothetical protein
VAKKGAARVAKGLIDYAGDMSTAAPYAVAGAGAYGALSPEEAEAAPWGTLAKQLAKKTRKAFHGSPHDFDAFDVRKIGTGEGAQAYGHGLYFTSKEDIAKYYRDALTDPDNVPLQFKGRPVDEIWTDGIRERWDDVYKGLSEDDGYDMDIILSNLSQVNAVDDVHYVTESFSPHQKRLFRELVEPELTKPDVPKGKIYTVEIPDESNMLDWDKPLSEQPDNVKEALADMVVEDQEYLKRYPGGGLGERLGANAYSQLGDRLGTDAAGVSEYLREKGIPGITYKGATSGERNFVVFDDSHVNLLEKGQVDPALLAGLGAAGAMAASAIPGEDIDLETSLRVGDFVRRRAQKNAYWEALKGIGGIGSMLGSGWLAGLSTIPGYFNPLQSNEATEAGADWVADKLTYVPEDNAYMQGIGEMLNSAMPHLQPYADRFERAWPESVPGRAWNSLPESTRGLLLGVSEVF